MNIGIVGLGLMGASLGKALVRSGKYNVLGYDIDESVVKIATHSKAQTRALEESDIGDLDVVFFALCPKAASGEMKRICPKLKSGAIVADLCGVKRYVESEMSALKKEFPHLKFVGTHPMAGKERGGIENSSSNLFEGAYIILVQMGGDESALKTVEEIYMQTGARGITVCSAEEHDTVVAYTSQMAHLVSNCYVQNDLSGKHFGFSAGSFGDLTRVARLNPKMWTELFLLNRDKLAECTHDIVVRLQKFEEALERCDGDSICTMLDYGLKCKESSDLTEGDYEPN